MFHLYVQCHRLWNVRSKYVGPIKVSKHKVSAFYTNVCNMKCEVYLGRNLSEMVAYLFSCKQSKVTSAHGKNIWMTRGWTI